MFFIVIVIRSQVGIYTQSRYRSTSWLEIFQAAIHSNSLVQIKSYSFWDVERSKVSVRCSSQHRRRASVGPKIVVHGNGVEVRLWS